MNATKTPGFDVNLPKMMKENLKVRAVLSDKNLIHILISWAIFTIFYWIAAYYKPFHVDEFYSWVYSERCTFQEILMLKDFGIGHPPLYHLIQKLVQTIFTVYHPAQVRLANYIIGSVFVMLLVRMLSKEKVFPLFFYGLSSSAGLLNVFVFGRMWGLVCLFSLLILRTGEKIIENCGRSGMLRFIGLCFLGFVSDYSFVLLIPYIMIVLFSHSRYMQRLVYIMPVFLASAWVFLTCFVNFSRGQGINSLLYNLLGSPIRISYESGVALFNFWFNEPFMIALGSVILCYWLDLKEKGNPSKTHGKIEILPLITLFTIILIPMEILIRADILKVRYTLFFIMLILALLLWAVKKNHQVRLNFTRDSRLYVSTACALLVLLCFHSSNLFIWRDLRDARFITILLPFILLLIYRVSGRKMIYSISLVFFISGFLYIASTGIADYYPPPIVEKTSPVIFQDEFAYSTQYLRGRGNASENPFIMRFNGFDSFCRVCRMGTSDIPFDTFNRFRIIVRKDFDPGREQPPLPPGFRLSHMDKRNFTCLDEFQFKYFNAIYPRHFIVSEYYRISDDTNVRNLNSR